MHVKSDAGQKTAGRPDLSQSLPQGRSGEHSPGPMGTRPVFAQIHTDPACNDIELVALGAKVLAIWKREADYCDAWHGEETLAGDRIYRAQAGRNQRRLDPVFKAIRATAATTLAGFRVKALAA